MMVFAEQLGALGPFTLTGEVSLTSLATLITIVVVATKLINHMGRVNDRVDQLWVSMMGDGPQDEGSFFHRFTVIEERVNEIWKRLRFNQLSGKNG